MKYKKVLIVTVCLAVAFFLFSKLFSYFYYGLIYNELMGDIKKICNVDFSGYKQIRNDKPYFIKEGTIYVFDSDITENIVKSELIPVESLLKIIYQPNGLILDIIINPNCSDNSYIYDHLFIITQENNKNYLTIFELYNKKFIAKVLTEAEAFSNIYYDYEIEWGDDIIICQNNTSTEFYFYSIEGKLQETKKFELQTQYAKLHDGNYLYLMNDKIYYFNFDYKNNISLYILKSERYDISQFKLIDYYPGFSISFYDGKEILNVDLYDNGYDRSTRKPSLTKKVLYNDQEVEYKEYYFDLLLSDTISLTGLKSSYWIDRMPVVCFKDGIGWYKYGTPHLRMITDKQFNYLGFFNAFHYKNPIFYYTSKGKTELMGCAIYDFTGNADTPSEFHLVNYPLITGKPIGVFDAQYTSSDKPSFFILTEDALYIGTTPVKYKDFGG